MPDGYLILIRDPMIHRELKLSDSQKQSIRQLTDELDSPLWALQNQSAERTKDGVQKLIATAEARIEQVLNETQRKRLAQIRLTVMGLPVLLRDDISQKLMLSDDQRSRIEGVLKEMSAADGDRSRSKPNDSAAPGKPASTDRNLSDQVMTIFSRDQIVTFRDLFGPPLNAAKLGYVRFKAPELVSGGEWINSKPLTLAQLRGKVVVVHFWTFGCINCIHNHPHYRGWNESFASRGLTLIGIHTPETDGERDIETVKQKTAEAKFEFPVLIDNDRRNWNAWGNSMWPAVYLIDKHGDVRYWWFGELNWQGAEGEKLLRSRINELLVEK
jgi:peroxiredoxin